MSRISPVSIEEAAPESRSELERQIAAHGRVTNMKYTLARSPAALAALMHWYPLYDVVVEFLGKRATTLFVHAISTETDCLVCSTFFRRWLSEQGENPDALALDDREQALVDFGRQLAQDAHQVSDELFGRLTSFLNEEQMVALTAFGALMLATNVFNNALRVDLDNYLEPYRRPADLHAQSRRSTT
jgi:alkylhydroperoxidase family enzyme